MTFENRAGAREGNDDLLRSELIAAGIEPGNFEILRKQGEVKSSVRGHLLGWFFERGWSYWVATGPGLDVETAEALWEQHRDSVRVCGDATSPSPRAHFKGLGSGEYHVDTQDGLNALAAAIKGLSAQSDVSPYAEESSVGEEIERKFLVNDGWREAAIGHIAVIRQGYLNSSPERTVRVRVQDGLGVLTIKGLGDESGERRPELNKRLSIAEANFMFDLCERGAIDKTRHFIEHKGYLFEVDEFAGDNEGLVVAEISFKTQGESFERPAWLGEEVTNRAEYYNSSLTKRPYTTWGKSEEPA